MDILKYENFFATKGYKNIVGIDEAGRGPLAGPVVAVALNWGNKDIIDGVNDSKKISEKKRLLLFDQIIENALEIGIGIVHEEKIDQINILQATYLAMRTAVEKLTIRPDMLLVDGNKADIKNFEQKNIIKGDSLSYSIACASIIAKVTRDKLMIQYDKIFPDYGFCKHKGYGTKKHLEVIKKSYACPIHRKSFRPIIDYLPNLKIFKNNNQVRLLASQIVSVYLIKKNYKIISFNDKYDLLLYSDKLIVFSSINILINDKTINSKNPLNGVNFNYEIKNFIDELGIRPFNKFRLDSIDITFRKTGPDILIKKGVLNEI
jgi:ribonuclease HII